MWCIGFSLYLQNHNAGSGSNKVKVYIVTKCFVEKDGCPTENVAVFESVKDAYALVKVYDAVGSTQLIYAVQEWEVK